jgi:ubiquinone/menaquinone biosynthesis C-methylase UbiE
MEKVKVSPLTEIEYAECFQVFAERSHEYEVMLSNIMNIINNMNNKKIKMLSIGAGTGYFDSQILKKINHEVIYHAIEPNEKHITLLQKTLEPYKNIKIHKNYFSENTRLDEKYDVILFSHSLYPINNPYSSVKNALNFLEDTGKLIIVHQTSKGMCPFVNKYYKFILFDKSPLADHTFDSNDIVKQLMNKEIKVNSTETYSYIDFSDINNKEIQEKMLSFFLQTNYSKLPYNLQLNMIYDIKNNMDEKNRYLHPTGLITIEYNL